MTQSGVDAVGRLAETLLAESERQFAAWFEKIAEA
jgi:hypothetical protein